MKNSVILPSASSAIAALLLSMLAVQPGQAGERVGVAAAVTPSATSKPPGGSTRTLKIGKSVVYNERITTSDSGVVQVLLVDGSTFTVGPNSNLVIDKFVYNSKTGTGELAVTFSKGALRFVGGKLSKRDPGVKIKTPAGNLTVRGGIFQGVVRNSNQAVFAFVFGHYLKISRGGRLYTIRDTGNLFSINGRGAPAIRPTTVADTNLLLAAVSGRTIKTGGRTYKAKGRSWPFYYGVQPTGLYPDEPFVKQHYFDGPFTGRLTRVPEPKVVVPAYEHHRQVHTPSYVKKPSINNITPPGNTITCPNC